MKFLFVIPSLSKGGAERVVSVLASALVEMGHEASVLVYFKTENEYEMSESVKKIYLSDGFEEAYDSMNYFERLSKIRKVAKVEKPDFVVPFLSHVCIQTCVALFGTKHKIIQTVRNDPRTLPEGKLHRFLRDLFIKFSFKTFVQNENQKSYFDEKTQKKIFVLPNPVRGDLFDCKSQKDNEKLVIASAGRLNSQKNFFMLIDAFEKVFQNHKKIVLEIFGDGELKEQLEKYITDKGLDECVNLMGRTNDMKSMFESIDLYVLSSDYEGMPNSLMEAMAAGVPCVSTDCPTGPSDLIIDGENGLLVPVNDSDAMSGAIEKMLFQLDKEKIANSGREFVKENYSAEVIASRLLENIGG